MPQVSTVQSVKESIAKIVGADALMAMESSGRLVVTRSDLLGVDNIPVVARNSMAAVSRMVKDQGFALHLSRIRQAKERAIAAIGQVEDCAIVKSKHRDAWQMILADASTPGKWRIQTFDARGFTGHMVFKDKQEAVEYAATHDYVDRDDSALDRVFDTPAFQRGLFASDLLTRINMGQMTLEQGNVELARYDEAQSVMASVAKMGAQAFVGGDNRVMVLLADRIPQGQESAVFLHEITHVWGKQAMNPIAWSKLLDQVKSWAGRPRQSVERRIHDSAQSRVVAARVSSRLADEEFFAYAVEEAVKLGVKPSAAALEDSASAWLQHVVDTLEKTLLSATQSSELGRLGVTRFPHDLQQLVDLAYAMAQLESPSRSRQIWERLSPEHREQLNTLLSSKGLERISSVMETQDAQGYLSQMQALVSSAPPELEKAPAGKWLNWIKKQADRSGLDPTSGSLGGVDKWLAALGSARVGQQEVQRFVTSGVAWQVQPGSDVEGGYFVRLKLNSHVAGIPDDIALIKANSQSRDGLRVLHISEVSLVDPSKELQTATENLAAFEARSRQLYGDYLHESSWRGSDDKDASMRLSARLAAMTPMMDIAAHQQSQAQYASLVAALSSAKSISETMAGASGWAGLAAHRLLVEAALQGFDAIEVPSGAIRDAIDRQVGHSTQGESLVRIEPEMCARLLSSLPKFDFSGTRERSKDSANEPWYFSKLDQALGCAPKRLEGQSAVQWIKWLEGNSQRLGIKQAELQWSGLTDWLALQGEAPVFAARLRAFVKANGVRVTEVEFSQDGEDSLFERPLKDRETDQWVVYSNSDQEVGRFEDEQDAWDYLSRVQRPSARALMEHIRPEGLKAGGQISNYRELVLTLIDSDAKGRGGFYSDWDSDRLDPLGVIAHVRLDDRVGPDGKRVLMVHELRSDWAQALKAQDKSGTEGISAMPFAGTQGWLDLVLKRLVVLAAQQGYDEVAFASGELLVDNDPWVAGVDRLQWIADSTDSNSAIVAVPSGRLIAYGDDGQELVTKGPMRQSEVAYHLGARLAQAVFNSPAQTLHAHEIKDAVAPLKAFHDSTVPSSLARVLGMVGARDAQSDGLSVTVNGKSRMLGGFVVTPQLKESLREGEQKFPLFSHTDGILRDAQGDPIVVYRGEHSADGQWLRTRLPGLTFSTASVANIYAQEPNDLGDLDGEMAPRIMAAHLVMKRPFVNTPGDPFIELSDVVAALGQDKALKIALDNAEVIQETSAWLDADDVGDSVEQFLARNPSEVTRFYVDAYRLLDDPQVVQWLIDAGYDGAIHCGNGAGAHEPEYRVFSPEQVNPVWASDALLPDIPDSQARVEAFLDHWRASDAYGEPPIAESVRFVGNLVREFAQSKGVVAEFAAWAPFGQTTGLELTDLFADEPGSGAGTQVMQELARLADQVGISVYLRAADTRSREFYERCGYEQSKGHFGFMVRYPSFDDMEGPDGDGPGRPGPGGGAPAPSQESADALEPAFSFAGEAAQDAPVASLHLAKARIAKGEDVASVREQTGWFCGPDARWRFEIDDSAADIRAQPSSVRDDLQARGKVTLMLGQLLDHPRLMHAYPWLKGVEVSIEVGRTGGVFESSGSDGVGGRIVMGVASPESDLSLSVLLHEVQHAIQRSEGFASGGTPSGLAWASGAMRPHLLEQTQALVGQLVPPSYELFWGQERSEQGELAYAEFLKEWHSDEYQRQLRVASQHGAAARVYERLAGEVEARDVQARLGLNEQQRRSVVPALQTPQQDLVVVLNGKEMHDTTGAMQAAVPQTLEQVRAIWDALGVDHFLIESDRRIHLSQIVLPKSRRGQGVGTQAMNALMSYADAVGKRVELSPSTDFGASSKARLQRFYRRFGFVANQGNRRDFTTSETMLREPSGPGFMDLRPNENGQELRTYKVGDTTMVLSVSPFEPGVVHLQSLRTPVTKRGKGSARSAMKALLAQADKQGVSINLIASALDRQTNQTGLGLFYRSLGFETTGRRVNAWGHPEMVRHAAPLTNVHEVMPEILEVDGVMRPTRNSRGMFIHSDIGAIEKFWRWYANGGQSPSLVDPDGRPLVLYHGTNEDVDALDVARERTRESVKAVYATNDAKVASEFALYRSVWPGANVMPIYARASKVLVIEGKGQSIRSIESEIDTARLAAWSMSRRGDLEKLESVWVGLEAQIGINLSGMEPSPDESLRSFAKRMGYEAIVFRDVRDDVGPDMPVASDVHVLLEPVSIKSATGNLGTFDPLQSSVRMSMPSAVNEPAFPAVISEEIVLSEAEIALMFKGQPNLRGLPRASETMQWLARGSNAVGPVYRGHGIEVHAVAQIQQDDFDDQAGFARFGLMGHAARCVAQTRTFAFKVVQSGSQKTVGSLVCDVDASDNIVSVHDIATISRGQGHGTRLLSHLVANAPDNIIKIQEITNDSEGFWRRLNVGYIDTYRDAQLEGGFTQGENNDAARAILGSNSHRTGDRADGLDSKTQSSQLDSASADTAGEVGRDEGQPGREFAAQWSLISSRAQQVSEGDLPRSVTGLEVTEASEADLLAFADDLGLDFAHIGRRWVKDARGADLKLYHGTNAAFAEFGSNPRGIFLAEDPAKASTFKAIRKGGEPRVIEARINVNKVWEVIRYGDDVPYSQMIDQSVDALKKQGYDAMHCPDDGVWIVFDPKQIDILRHDIDQQVDEVDEVAARLSAEMEDVRQLYGKAADWLKAPNGAPTRLSQRQWLLVRTDSFKAWFGDWQKDPVNASKALDENGEPKVYFHGSKEAGFTQFDTDGRRKTDGTGAFFASDARMAGGYSGGSETTPVYLPEQILKDPDVIDGLEIEKGILVSVVVSSQGRKGWSWFESEQQAREELGLAADEPIESKEGYRVLVDGYEELVGDKQAVLDHLADMRTKEPGMYEVFLNIRDMVDIDWGGKNWDEGPQEDVWDIEDENGNQIDWAYNEEERDAMLASNPGSVAVHRTQSVYDSSDDAARQARQMGADGVLLRNIWDTGPAGYAEDGDVCVVFEPENIKWADNVGSFDPATSDIRFSMPVKEDVELPAKGAKKPLNLTLKAGHKGYFDAYVGKRRVGAICGWEDSRGEFVVMEVVVSAPYRRRGVATAMYRAVEEQAGRQLKPAVSLSDDGFEFWKAFRPEAVAEDLRHRLDELIGRKGVKNGREGIITKASGGTATLTHPDGMHTTVLRRELDDVLLPLEPDDGPGDGPGGLPVGTSGDKADDEGQVAAVDVEDEATDVLTGAPAFRAWFSGSKVVDADGSPRIVYHGTVVRPDTDKVKGMGDIQAFDRMFTTQFRAPSLDTVGSWFSTNPGQGGAEMYSGNHPGSAIYPVYLSIQNPQVTTFQLLQRRARLLANGKDDGRQIGAPEVEAYRQWLKATGKDGIKIEGSGNEGSTEFDQQEAWIALEPQQIKSAIGNNGDFDADNPDIRLSVPQNKAAMFATALADVSAVATLDFEDYTDTEVELTNLEVWDKGRGYGTRVMRRVVAEADKAGINLMLIPAGNAEKRAQFYARFGFVEDGDVMRRPAQTVRDALDLRDLDIRFSVPQAPAPVFFSALAKEVASLPAKTNTIDGWIELINGLAKAGKVRDEEVKWTGLADWLFQMEAQQRRITREELVSYLQENSVHVEEVTLGGDTKLSDNLLAYIEDTGRPMPQGVGEWADEAQMAEAAANRMEASGYRLRAEQARALAEEMRSINKTTGGGAKYRQYTLPGGSNYREVLLTLPIEMQAVDIPDGAAKQMPTVFKRQDGLFELLDPFGEPISSMSFANREEAQAAAQEWAAPKSIRQIKEVGPRYQSAHWDAPNVLAHIRLNDRVDANGHKTLFVEEIQSDWAQQGRKFGFVEEGAAERMPGLIGQYDALNARRRELEAKIASGDDADPRTQADIQAAIEVGAQMEALAAEMTRIRTSAKDGTPLAPFVGKTDGWLGLSLRRIMKMAVDGGYDNVAFVSGEQAADRFLLSKQVDEVEVFKSTVDTYDLRIDPIDGDRFYKRGLSPQGLEEHVGKDMAASLIEAADQYELADGVYRAALRQTGIPEDVLDDLVAKRNAVKTVFAGMDLKVGGAGMKAFYGNVLPATLKPLLRKLGGAGLSQIQLGGGSGQSNEVSINGTVVSDVLTGNSLYFAGSPDEARQWSEDEGYTVVSASSSQLGFAITPKMRDLLADGVPLFSFAGPQALTANLQSMAGAQTRLDDGDDPERVRQETGWFAGADGRLRFEIDDSQAFAKGTDTYGDLLMRWYHAGVQRTGDQAYKVRLGDVLYHAKLFDAYPGLAELEVQMMPAGVAARGRLVIENGQPSIIQINEFLDSKTWVNVALHELQHAIQEIERFEPGSSPADFVSDTDAVGQVAEDRSLAAHKAHKDGYRRSAGEVEARNVQARQNLSQRERLATPPASTQDVAEPILMGVRNQQTSTDQAVVLDMGDGVLRVQRAQVGGDRPRAATGEAGDGIYAYFPKSTAMRRYYMGKRSEVGEASLWDIDLDASRVVDLTQPQNMAELLTYARAQFSQLERSMPGYVTPVVSAHNIQRFGRIVEGFVRAHRPWAGAWIIGHKGPGIPTSRQVVIADESAMLSAVERPSARFVSEELVQPERNQPVEQDWLTMLFGEQAPTTSVSSAEPSVLHLDAAELAQSLRAFAAQKQGEALDWASRRYKFNPRSVSLAGDGPRREETISVQRANESRRRKMVDSLMAQSKAATGLALKVEDGMDFATQWAAVEAAVERDIARNGGVGRAHGTKERMTQAYASSMLLGDAYGSFGDGTLACHLSQLVQAARGEVDSVAMSVNAVARDSKAFQVWGQGLPFVEEGWNDYGGGPGVFVAYHGTTHSDITAFKRTGNPDGFLGEGPYFTSSAKDASENYAGEGPDLLGRISNAAEGYGDQFEEDDSAAQEMLNAYFSASGINEFVTDETTDAEFDELKESHGGEAINFAATRSIKGDSDGLVMKVFVRLSNPADTVRHQWLEAQWADDIVGAASEDGSTDDDEIEEPLRDWTDLKGPLAEWLQAAQIMVSDEHVFNAYAMAVMERVGEDDGVHMRDLFEMALEHFREFGAEQDSSAGAVFRDIAKEAGYDGVVMSAWRHFGPKPDAYGRMSRSAMPGIDEETVHLVPFSSSQVKSATGNSGAFDPSQADIRLSVPANNRERVEGAGSRTEAAPQGLAARAVHDVSMDPVPASSVGNQAGQKIGAQIVYHVTPTRNVASILDGGIEPRVGELSRALGEKVARSYHFASAQALDDALCGWLADAFDEDVSLAVVAVDVSGLTVEESPAGYEVQVLEQIDPARLCLVHNQIDSLTSPGLLALASQAQERLHSRRRVLADDEEPQVAMSFAGATAKTADLDALRRAQWGVGTGRPSREVWQMQGWALGADNKWRFEIDDSHAHVDLTMLRNIAQGNVCAGMPEVQSITYKVSQAEDGQDLFDVTLVPPSPQKLSDIASFSSVDADLVEDVLGKEMLARMRAGEGDEDLIGDFEPAKRFATPGYAFEGFNALPLDRVLHHPTLFDAYPQLADILVTVDPDLESAAAFVIQDCEAGGKAFVRRLIRLKGVEIGKPQLLSAVLHEVQHAIQEIEGFATGGSPESAARYERSMRYQMTEQALTRLYALKDRFPGTYKAYQDMQSHFYACLSSHGIDAFAEDGSLRDLMALNRALQRVELPEQALRRHQLVDAYRRWMEKEVGEFGSPGMQAWSSAVNALSSARMASPEPGGSVYRRLAGEVEARNVQFRLAFDAAKRSESLPEDTADVSAQDQVFMPAC